MILYFFDRMWNILGQASTSLPEGIEVFEDLKTEDVESGIASFECEIPFTYDTRKNVERFTEVGNYILRKHDGKDEFFTIIDSEKETKGRYVYVYAEDAGLDLINEVYGAYEADKAYPIAHYVNKYANDSGFIIGINEISSRSRKLSWDGEATATERLASVATQFDCEISFSFEIEGLKLVNKYINIHAKRGKNDGVQLRLNKEIDNIITKKSIANLATALLCTGGTPEDENAEDNIEPAPITLAGYKYDDGEFYVDGKHLKSRTALKKWSRYLWQDEPNKQQGYEGHIVKLFSYETLSQKELCAHAVTELKKICDMEVNYEVDIANLPEGVQIGDTVYIVDDEGELYVETRILKLESSVANQTHKATLGDFLIKGSGISQKVADLSAQFAAEAKANAVALKAALEAKKKAEEAKKEAETATGNVEKLEESVMFSAQEQFYASTSPTALQGGSWQDAQPTWAEGVYIWRRTLVTYGNGTTEYTPNENGVCITGNTGADGKDGADGANGADGKDGKMILAKCTTAQGTVAKVATIVDGTLTLQAGATVSVKFTYSNTAASPTLNVGGTGAKRIRLNGANLTSEYSWMSGAYVVFVYDGTYWNVADASALKKAVEAAKTASNFISYDGTNGLQVGNKTSGAWSGYRTQMTATAFNILSEAGAVLASYGAKLIELGKNAQDAIIKLCGGKGQIEYDSSENFIQMTGENVRVKADNMASLYSYYYDGERTAKKSAVNVENTKISMFSSASYNVDPDTMVGTGDESGIDIDPVDISISAQNNIAMSGGNDVRIESGGSVELFGLNGVYSGSELYDRYDTLIGNGLAAYTGSGTSAIDPNTTLEGLILTNKNTPTTEFWFIETKFYSSKSTTANRIQIAYPYKTLGSQRFRYYTGSAWSAWAEQPVVIGSGASGVWNYKKYSDGTAEVFGKISVTSLAITTAIGGWYRSANVYKAGENAYPFSFSSVPTVSVQYGTNNGVGAVVWLNAEGTVNAPPTLYLIRPTSASGAAGYIFIHAKGKI